MDIPIWDTIIVCITINNTMTVKPKFAGPRQNAEKSERPHDPTSARGQEEKECELRGEENQ